MSFDGETGPYIEYCYARINSIFRKLESNIEKYIQNSDVSFLKEKNEFEMVKELAKYPLIIEESATNFKPSIIAHYMLGLAQKFNEFYHANPILSSDEDTKKARLYLIYCVQTVLKSSMKLLNIEEIYEM